MENTEKVLDLNKTVYDLTQEYPEVKDIMAELGFQDITKPMALNLMGRVMTIPKGSQIKGISMERIVKAFEEHGFIVKDESNTLKNAGGKSVSPHTSDQEQKNLLRDATVQLDSASVDQAANMNTGADTNADTNAAKLKSLLTRLSDGEDFDTVQKDFITQFESVSVYDIMDAEQSMIRDGADPKKVQKLCDLHSALFHGRTEAEVMSEEKRKSDAGIANIPEGHPVDYFVRENSALEQIINRLKISTLQKNKEKVTADLATLRKIRTLYGKKEELIMPVLDQYGVTGPSEVMWGVDNEIKQEVSRLAKELSTKEISDIADDLEAVLKRMTEMIYKEENILLPTALEKFTDEQWVDIYRDLFEMGPVFIEEIPKWKHGEEELAFRKETSSKNQAAEDESLKDGVISFHGDGAASPAGKLTIAQLRGILQALPIDITFIDADTTNQFYKNTDKVFSRPLSSLGRSTYECHPVFVRPIVKALINDFKEGKRNTYERRIKMGARDVHIVYAAVRDEDGKYLGTVEIIQDLSKLSK